MWVLGVAREDPLQSRFRARGGAVAHVVEPQHKRRNGGLVLRSDVRASRALEHSLQGNDTGRMYVNRADRALELPGWTKVEVLCWPRQTQPDTPPKKQAEPQSDCHYSGRSDECSSAKIICSVCTKEQRVR